MTDLTAAMQAAVESMDSDRGRRDTLTGERVRATSGVTLVLDEHDLPAIRSAPRPPSFAATVRREYGPVAAAAWVSLREGLIFVALFWVAAILMAFVMAEQATAPMVLMVAVTLRGLLALARVFSPEGSG